MKHLITSVLICLLFNAHSQGLILEQISLFGGKNFSTFLYKDSQGLKDKDYELISLNTFGINAGFTAGKNILRPEIEFRQSGAKSLNSNNISLTWKMNYLNFSIGYLYSVIRSDRFSISPGIAIGYGYMLSGEQNIGEKRYSITETNSLSRHDLTCQAIANFRANLSQDLTLGLEYRFNAGIMQIENDLTPQKTHNLSHAALLVLGLRIK